MLTRLKVHGFKNLLGVDIFFGPFTCIAGANGVGKSNLFDAIRFLSVLAEKPLHEAALSVRGEGIRSGDATSLFHLVGKDRGGQMSFEAEMLIPAEGIDDLGQETKATMTFLRYKLDLELASNGLVIRKEELGHINKRDSRAHLPFPHRPAWRNSVVEGRRTSPFISTKETDGKIHILLHQDGGKEYLGGGRPRPHLAERLTRTVLSDATNAAESPTAVLVRREMQSWRLLQLEPTALRTPDSYDAPSTMDTSGAHLPATLARLAQWPGAGFFRKSDNSSQENENLAAALYAEIANRLAELIDDVHSIRVDADDRREILRLMLKDRDGTEHEARSLSDGTLRFLALAILENDPTARGVLCLEEPENGIHPERIPAMLRLLRDLATRPSEPADNANPLRQVIVNTHSPSVVGQIDDDDLLIVVPEETWRQGHPTVRPVFRWLSDTWRSRDRPNIDSISPGQLLTYLQPIEPRIKRKSQRRRVVDRPDVRQFSLFSLDPVEA